MNERERLEKVLKRVGLQDPFCEVFNLFKRWWIPLNRLWL